MSADALSEQFKALYDEWGAAIASKRHDWQEGFFTDDFLGTAQPSDQRLWDTPLNAILTNLGVTTLFFAGVNADHCVLGTLMDANFHGYDTILLEDCTATTSPDFCMQATLHNVRFCFGFTATSDDLVQSVGAAS